MKSIVLEDFKDFLIDSGFKSRVEKLIYKDYFHLIILKFIALLFFVILYRYFGLERISHEIGGVQTSKFNLLLNVVLLAPIIEEFMFRYHHRLSYGRLIISLLFCIVLLHSSFWNFLIFAIYIGGLAISMEYKTPPTRKMLVFISALAFSLLHLGNYTNLNFITDVYFIPVLIFSQFLSALILFYIFWNFGIKHSIAFHMLWNSIVLLHKILY